MITPVCKKCIYLSNEPVQFRRCPHIPIFHRDMLCSNAENARKDYVDGEPYKPYCEEVNRHGECLVYMPRGLEKPTIVFDEDDNAVAITGTKPFVASVDGSDLDAKMGLLGDFSGDENNELYAVDLFLDHSCTVKAACVEDGVLSDVAEFYCEIPDTPTIDFDKSTNTVTISSHNKVYYTTDGTEPSEESAVYSGAFVLGKNSTVKARSYARGEPSEVVTKDCVTIEPPVITFDHETDTVTITADDKILFSTDGSDIFDDADEYTAPFRIERNTTVKAVCIVDGELSEQSELLCRVPTKPEISYDPKTKTVSISSDNTVLYTTDGSDVKKKDSEYTAVFRITETTTVKARSIVDGRLSEQAELECIV